MSMAGYTKLFNSILASTIWRADDKIRLVWITLLAMADQHGIAEGSIPGLAHFAQVSIEDCERALEFLKSPDTYSRSQEQEGRRVEDVPGGWRLINHGMYRATMNADERRAYLKAKQREHRARKRAAVNASSTSVDKCQPAYTPSTQAEASTTASASTSTTSSFGSSDQPLPLGTTNSVPAARVDDGFDRFWLAYPKKKGKTAALKTWKKIRPSKILLLAILRAIDAQKVWPEWTKDAGQYIPHPASWLNAGRWADEPTEAQPQIISARAQQNVRNSQEAIKMLDRWKADKP